LHAKNVPKAEVAGIKGDKYFYQIRIYTNLSVFEQLVC